MFLTGPGVVREVMGEDVDAAELGGPRVHARNGVVPPRRGRRPRPPARLARDLLSYLPQRAGERAAGRAAAPSRRGDPARACRPTRARSTTCAG